MPEKVRNSAEYLQRGGHHYKKKGPRINPLHGQSYWEKRQSDFKRKKGGTTSNFLTRNWRN